MLTHAITWSSYLTTFTTISCKISEQFYHSHGCYKSIKCVCYGGRPLKTEPRQACCLQRIEWDCCQATQHLPYCHQARQPNLQQISLAGIHQLNEGILTPPDGRKDLKRSNTRSHARNLVFRVLRPNITSHQFCSSLLEPSERQRYWLTGSIDQFLQAEPALWLWWMPSPSRNLHYTALAGRHLRSAMFAALPEDFQVLGSSCQVWITSARFDLKRYLWSKPTSPKN